MRATARVIRDEHTRGLTSFTGRQIDAALEVIADGGIVHVGGYTFEVVSTDGSEHYLCTGFECTCAAGERDVSCYHQLAALVLQAA